ncbi:ester cyclase [Nonomuraea mangrovi]|uniref:Ester cyclase n=1 Tax=Nonomuraea mangrovi TaxID=2316207 RepID=A0ABW4SP09_9ACTN
MGSASTVVQEMLDAFGKRDFSRLRELCHPEYTSITGDGAERRGADVAVELAEMFTNAFPDLSFDVRGRYEQGGVVVTELTFRGTHLADFRDIPATGRKIEVCSCNVVEVRDGKIYRERDYYDMLTVLHQLGVPAG